MKHKLPILLLLMALLAQATAWADEPFRKHRYDLFKVLPPKEGSIVFVGNSITDMHPWVETFRTSEGQLLPIVNRGNSGTFSTEQSDNLESYLLNKPKKLFMMIGTNDIASNGLNFTGEQVLTQVKSIVTRIHLRSPQTKVYLYPILNNSTGNRQSERWLTYNRIVKEYVEESNQPWLKYIDIYDALSGIASGGVWSYDKLHPTAASYRIWCNEICEALTEGEDFTVSTVYPENAATVQQNGGLGSSNGMRATYFSLLPVTADDILFFGDEEVKNGEWNELLGNDFIKNRGTGWGFGGDIATTSKLVDATFAETGVNKAKPKAIIIYTATADLTGTTDINTVKNSYKALVDKVTALAPEAKVYLLSTHPVANATTNTGRTAVLNSYLATLATDQVRYLDCYTPFLSGSVADTRYIKNTNYLYGLGYVKMANIIADALRADFPADTYTVMTEAEAEAIHTQSTLRCTLSQAIAGGMVVKTGDKVGEYAQAGMAAYNAKVSEAVQMLENGELTNDQVTEIANTLNDLLNNALNHPTASTTDNEHWYQMHSVRLPDYYVTATAQAAGLVGDNTTAEYAQSMWKFVKRNDGSYDIVNRKYGSFLNPEATYDTQITTTTSTPSKGWTLSYANTPGCFIISSGEVQLNQTQSGLQYKIYNWSNQSTPGSDRGDAGCQFYINEAPSPIEEPETPAMIEYTISKLTGNLYRDGQANQSWNKEWRSNDTPTLTFASNANNMNWVDNNVQLMSGTAGTATYTLTAPSGYVIDSYSFKLANNNHSTGLTLTITNGPSYTTSTTAQTHSATNVGESNISMQLSGLNGNGVIFSEFNVTLKKTDGVAISRPTISTDEEQHWYYITSASTKSYCAGKVMYYDASIDRMRFGDKTFTAERIWSFWEKDGKLAIKNYAGDYIGTAGAGTGNSTQFGRSETANYIYTINDSYGFFTIKDTGVELHAQNDNTVIVRWGAEEGGASLWKFEPVDMSHPEVVIASTQVKQGKVTTGIGNKNQPIVRSMIRLGGLEGTKELQSISGRVVADDMNDIEAVKVYIGTNNLELFIDEDERMTWREQNGRLFGQAAQIAADGTFTVTGSENLVPGENYIWIAYDIADNATEGNTVDAVVTGYTIDGEDRAETAGDPQHKVTIFLSESAALMPYDCGSRYYRIPAITTVKKKLPTGETVDRLVVLTDDRLQHNGDLPNRVFVVAQYSDDLGRSWTAPVRVAGGSEELGGDYGHGDASIVTDRTNGNIIGIMTSAGTYGHGFFASTAAEPQLWKTIISSDGGETWSAPVDHTKSLYGVGSPNPTWKGGFSGSGAALQKRDGTLVSSFVNRDANNVQNFYFFMSKDGGTTWKVVGTSGTTGADEPKTLERNNGDLSIFVRANGYNFHNVTSDDGQTWHYAPQTRFTSGINGTACDGEYMVWCSTLDGNPWNIALETLPNANSRQNVSICLSTDEGETFGTPRTICPWSSAYSTAVVLPDGTLGVYYEEDGLHTGSNYVMRFVRFSLDWASGGKYKFTDEQPFHPIGSKGDNTGIVTLPATPQTANTLYDLQGRRIQTPASPGIYIRGNQKVFIGK